MGLDGVEFVMAVEEAFGLSIPDEDAQELITPGHLVDYLEKRLLAGQGACLEQRAFYSLRRAGIAVLGCRRSELRPETRWENVLPVKKRRRVWELLHHSTGVVPWPAMPFWSRRPPHETLGETARFMATFSAAAMQPAGVGWSRPQIESIVRSLMAQQLGIMEFEWNHRFVDELKVN
jgi:hypothetical protein